jgi:hypothetical protein
MKHDNITLISDEAKKRMHKKLLNDNNKLGNQSKSSALPNDAQG